MKPFQVEHCWESKHLDAIPYPLPQGWPIHIKIGDETTLFIDEVYFIDQVPGGQSC